MLRDVLQQVLGSFVYLVQSVLKTEEINVCT